MPTAIRENNYPSVEESLQSVRGVETTSEKEFFKELYEEYGNMFLIILY